MGLRVAPLAVMALVASCTPAMPEVQLGGVVDLNLATLGTNDEQMAKAYSTRARWGGGLVLEVHLGHRLAILTEPSYVGKGAKVTFTQPGASVTDVKLSYFEVPVFVKRYFGRKGIRPYVLAGPTIGFKTSATVSFEFDGFEGLRQTDGDVSGPVRSGATLGPSSQFAKVDLGFGLGAGVSLPVGRARAFVEGQYGLGLTNIDRWTEWQTETKNQCLHLRAGLVLALGAKE